MGHLGFQSKWVRFCALGVSIAFVTILVGNGCGSGFNSKMFGEKIKNDRKIQCEDRNGEVSLYEMASLTPYQYAYTLEDLLSRSLSETELNEIFQAASKAPLPTAENGFDSHTKVSISADFVESKMEIAKIFSRILTLQITRDCLDVNCAKAALDKFLERALNKIYSESQIASVKVKLLGVFSSSILRDADIKQATEDALWALFSGLSFHIKFLNNDSQNIMTSLELGKKLSYFLLSSLPDDLLAKDIQSGRIQDSGVRIQHVRRILSNPNYLRRFSFQFLSQFLGFKGTYQASNESKFNDITKRDIYDSEVLFFEHVLSNNLPIGALIESGVVFANDSIADKFNLSGTRGQTLVPVQSNEYTGLLTHPLIFMKTFKESEKKLYVGRGSLIQQRFICQKLPNISQSTIEQIEKIEQELKDKGIGSVRGMIEYHRSNPACLSCHQYIDGFGIALEKYNGFGGFREHYSDGNAVDASGELLGQTYVDHRGMMQILRNSLEFKSCFVRQVNSFASQMDFYKSSNCLVADVVAGASEEMPLRNLIESLVSSPQFAMKKQ